MGYFPKGAILTGFGEPLTLFKKPIECGRCGKQGLYWQKHYGKWRLHHYASLDGKTTEFVLHQCGKTADGKPSEHFPWPKPATPTDQVKDGKGD